MAPWYRHDPAEGAVVLSIHAQPQARRTEVVGLHGESLKVRVAAPALDNRANEALIAFIAERFGVARRDVTLLSGEKSREKRLSVRSAGVDPEKALAPAAAR
ncbi:MAG: YggU family protein [Betaproteobacteria bacterium]|nr:YggU family protein [Betaproteobacteria bacterium]